MTRPVFGQPVPWTPKVRMTFKQARERRIAMGLHPFRGDPLGPPGETCGSCAHRRKKQRAGTWYKCILGPITGGPATDIKLRWPSCSEWRPDEDPEEA